MTATRWNGWGGLSGAFMQSAQLSLTGTVPYWTSRASAWNRVHTCWRTTSFLQSCSRFRSEERRVGKECRSRWSPYHLKKKTAYEMELWLEFRRVLFRSLDIQSFGVEPSAYLLAHDFIPSELLEVYRGVVAQALDGVRRCFERAGNVRSLRLHGDCHVGNVLWTDVGPHFLDFDDSRMGPAIQDLWMLLSGERAEQMQQLGDLLAGYEDFYDFDPRELHLLEALRTLRLIHYSAWIARRWDDAAFPVAFPWFNTQRYWQDRILELREQIALMDEPPLQC